MRVRRPIPFPFRAAAGVVALSLALAAPASAEIVERFRAGVWAGGAELDARGFMRECRLSGRYERGRITIHLRWMQDGFHVTLTGDRFRYVPGDTFNSRVRIDNQFLARVTASVVLADTLDFPFGKAARPRNAIADGLRARFGTPGDPVEVPLNGTRAAIGELMRCAGRYFPANPAAAPYPFPPPPGSDMPTAAPKPVADGVQVIARELTVDNLAALGGADPVRDPAPAPAPSVPGPAEIAAALAPLADVDPEALLSEALAGFAAEGAPQDPAMAAKWIARASGQGNPVATYTLSLMLDGGVGMRPNPWLAEELLDEAAAAGIGPALLRRAQRRLPDDPVAALGDLRAAAATGDPRAERLLGAYAVATGAVGTPPVAEFRKLPAKK